MSCSEWTLHTGEQNSQHKININWSDQNNLLHRDAIEIRIQERDKPRTLEIRLNGAILATLPSDY
jgi:hypothetical protein